jgi:DNA recombination protein RmuC
MELKKEVEEVISLRSSNQLLQSRMDDMQREMLEYKNKDEEKNKEIQNNIRIIAQYKTQQEALTEKLDNQKNEILNLREELNKEFKLLANEILEEKSKKFSRRNL